MKTARNSYNFKRLPNDYPGLCKLLTPRPIHDKLELENVTELATSMAGHTLTSDQTDYFDLLCRLIAEYEREHVPAPKVSGTQALRHLLDEHQMTGADLSTLLGTHRTLGPMILRGERKLTAEHIRTLSAHFGVSADLFLSE